MSKKDIFYRIIKWNEQRGLLDKFNNHTEFKMLLEECLELVSTDKEYIKKTVDDIINMIKVDNIWAQDKLDACYDLIYISIGTASKILKRLYSIYEKDITIDDIALIIKAGLNRVIDANDKKGLERNEQGKIIKSKDFVEPIIPLTLDDLTIEERDGCCYRCKEEHDDAG